MDDTGKQSGELQEQVRELRRRLARLEQQIDSLTSALAAQGVRIGPVGPPPPRPPAPAPDARGPEAVAELLAELSEPKPPVAPPAPVPPFVVTVAAVPPAPAGAPPPLPTAGPKGPPAAVPPVAAAPVAVASAVVAPAPVKPKKPAVSLEQRLGVSWMSKIGIVIFILGALFFFQYAAQQGWITPVMKVLLGGAAGLVLLAVGEWTFRKQMRIFSAAVTGGGIALLYICDYVASGASPRLLGLISTPVAFGLMTVVTALAVALSLRSGLITTAILAQIGAYLTPILLSTGQNQLVGLMVYMLALAIGFLVVAYVRRWPALPVLSLVATTVIFAGWYWRFYHDYFSLTQLALTDLFAWCFLIVFGAYAGLASARQRLADRMGMALAISVLALMAALLAFQIQDGPPAAILGQLIALAATALAGSMVKRWPVLAPTGLAACAIVFAAWLGGGAYSHEQWSACDAFAWALLALMLAYALVNAFRRAVNEKLSVGMVIAGGLLLMLLWAVQLPGLTMARLFPQVLALNAVLLVVAIMRRWIALPIVFAAATAVLFRGTMAAFSDAPAGQMLAWAWALLGLFLAYVVIARLVGRQRDQMDVGLVAGGGSLLAVLLCALGDGVPDWSRCANLMILDAVVLVLALWRKWNWLRLGALAWTAGTLFITFDYAATNEPGLAERWSAWIWPLAALFLADVLARAWWKGRQSNERLDAALATTAVGLMFGTTYYLLNPAHHPWMGAYTFLLAAAALGVAWLVRFRAQRVLGYAWLGVGLVLLTLGMPIQFEKVTLTIAWGAQAVVAMFIARRLVSRLMAAKAAVVLLLATGHFAFIDRLHDSRLAEVMFSISGTPLAYIVLVGIGLTLAGLLCAVLIGRGKPIVGADGDFVLMWGFVTLAAIVWLWQAAEQLPAVTSTWCWLAFAAGLTAVGLRRRIRWAAIYGLLLLALTDAKFVVYDTLGRAIFGATDPGWLTALNWQFGLALVLAATCVAGVIMARRRWPESPQARTLDIVTGLLGAFVVLWAGSFEVHRFFANSPGRFENVANAGQMGYSVWWACYAVILLVVGLVVRRPAIRWMSLILFGVTLAKVLLVDMAGVGLVYRIASFLALGTLLVAASFLYQRYFHAMLSGKGTPAPAQAAQEAAPVADQER